METPIQVNRYGTIVWETTEMDSIRKEHCMCHHCAKMKPGQEDHCKIAAAFYEICKAHGTAFILTRCCDWEQRGLNE